ncbi:MAG: holo-[acyl-carrier-protein] synthase [Thermoleophilia bacterium]|nr:holo-[acyl-carrier-protein] synthase [Thermoleophilia bacterium]
MSEVLGIGIDLIEIDRVEAALARHPRFASRCFTPAERVYCESCRYPPQHFAARFAAKEAVGKALGIGMTRWHEVEVARERGAPTAILAGRCRARADEMGVVEVLVSLTHSRGMAAAVAILQGR